LPVTQKLSDASGVTGQRRMDCLAYFREKIPDARDMNSPATLFEANARIHLAGKLDDTFAPERIFQENRNAPRLTPTLRSPRGCGGLIWNVMPALIHRRDGLVVVSFKSLREALARALMTREF